MLDDQEVYQILRDWKSYEWQVQGFGMLRTYLKGEGEPRLQIWDQRLAVWGNGAIHDHPWDFRSRIIAGTLFNQRYRRYHRDGVSQLDIDLIGKQHEFSWYNELKIQPGLDGGPLEGAAPARTQLRAEPIEVYAKTEEYTMEAAELHITRYANGTVTMIERERVTGSDTASSLWKDGPHWSFFRPRPATPQEAAKVIGDCLYNWWL
jgi:hypothetical protein